MSSSHPRSDTARIYLSRKKGAEGLISREACVSGDEKNLSWNVRNCPEALLRKLGERGTVTVNKAKDARERKKNKKREMAN